MQLKTATLFQTPVYCSFPVDLSITVYSFAYTTQPIYIAVLTFLIHFWHIVTNLLQVWMHLKYFPYNLFGPAIMTYQKSPHLFSGIMLQRKSGCYWSTVESILNNVEKLEDCIGSPFLSKMKFHLWKYKSKILCWSNSSYHQLIFKIQSLSKHSVSVQLVSVAFVTIPSPYFYFLSIMWKRLGLTPLNVSVQPCDMEMV